MLSKNLIAVIIGVGVMMISCNKKQQPQNATAALRDSATGVAVRKAPTRKVLKLAVPKIIIVDDRTASKTIDGRLFYDLEGHRYWRNYDDGKYYLYNQSMYTNKAFKPH